MAEYIYDSDICVINSTRSNLDAYVEVSNLYSWVCTNRDWSKAKSGGAGFIMKNIRYELVMCDGEDISLKKIGRMYGKFEWLLGSIYMNCEGIRREENEKRRI